MLEIETENTRWHCVKNSLWGKLGAFRKTDCRQYCNLEVQRKIMQSDKYTLGVKTLSSRLLELQGA